MNIAHLISSKWVPKDEIWYTEIQKQMAKSLDRMARDMFTLHIKEKTMFTLHIKEMTMRKFVLKSLTPGYGPYFEVQYGFAGPQLWATQAPGATRYASRDDAEMALTRVLQNHEVKVYCDVVTREVEVTPGAREIRVVGEGEARTGYIVNVFGPEWFLSDKTPFTSQVIDKATVYPNLNAAAIALVKYVNQYDWQAYRGPANILPVFVTEGKETVTEVPGQ